MNLFKVPKTLDELKSYEKRSMNIVGLLYLFLSVVCLWPLWNKGIINVYENNFLNFCFLISMGFLFFIMGVMDIIYGRGVHQYQSSKNLLNHRKKLFFFMRTCLSFMGMALVYMLYRHSEYITATVMLFIFIAAELIMTTYDRALDKNFKGSL